MHAFSYYSNFSLDILQISNGYDIRNVISIVLLIIGWLLPKSVPGLQNISLTNWYDQQIQPTDIRYEKIDQLIRPTNKRNEIDLKALDTNKKKDWERKKEKETMSCWAWKDYCMGRHISCGRIIYLYALWDWKIYLL